MLTALVVLLVPLAYTIVGVSTVAVTTGIDMVSGSQIQYHERSLVGGFLLAVRHWKYR